MSEAEKEARLKKDLERLRVLRPIDDGFMLCLFKDSLPLVQFVLRIILQKPERTRFLKEDQKGVQEMCKVFEDILNEGREEGMEKGMEKALLASLRSLMEKLGYTVEQAMDALSVPGEARARLASQI